MSLSQPDLDLLADYVGGALDGTPDSERVGERIRTDAAWASAYADLVAALESVDTDLHLFGAQYEPMPDDVWTRLEAALSAESSAPRTPAPQPAGPPSAPEFTAPRDNRPPSRATARRRRWMAPVLAGVGVLFAVTVGIAAVRGPTNMFDNMQTDSGAGTAADAPAAAGPPILQRASGRDYTADTLVLATDFGSTTSLYSYASPAPQEAGGDTSKSVPKTTRSFASPVPNPLARLTDPAELAKCLDAVRTVTPGQVVGVDYATYEHTPAALIVVRTPANADWVGVAGAECGNQGADLLAQKLVN